LTAEVLTKNFKIALAVLVLQFALQFEPPFIRFNEQVRVFITCSVALGVFSRQLNWWIKCDAHVDVGA